ncbi:MAG: Fe(3+) ABC transporter substrate-binding protein [Alphaproteobacteria bacterium]
MDAFFLNVCGWRHHLKRLNMYRKTLWISAAVLVLGFPLAAVAATEVNIYSARHYPSDRLLYDGFTKSAGVKVNLIEGRGPELLARLKAEGKNSPGDVFLTVDAGNLWLAEQSHVFQPVRSAILESRIPANLRDPENLWFGFATRARAIFVNPTKVDPKSIKGYADLASPFLKGKVCMRSSSEIYNLSLLGALIAHWGEKRAGEWVKGVVANLAKPIAGNDTSLLKDVAAGACGVTIANHYYYVRLKTSENEADRRAANAVKIVWPDQDGFGTNVNISGGGVLKNAPHKQNAVKFLEYLASDAAQRVFTDENREFPIAPSVPPSDAVKALGPFKADTLNVAVFGENQAKAQMLFDKYGWR